MMEMLHLAAMSQTFLKMMKVQEESNVRLPKKMLNNGRLELCLYS